MSKFLAWSFWSRPIMLWFAHVAPILWLSAAIGVPLSLLLPTWAGITIPLMLIAGTALAVFAEFTHDWQMCIRCADRIPLNTSDKAKRLRATLWFHHHNQWLLLPVIPVMVLDAAGGLPELLHYIKFVTVALYFAASAHAFLIHRVHRPWCPFCDRWDKDDNARTEKTPDPTPPGKPTPAR